MKNVSDGLINRFWTAKERTNEYEENSELLKKLTKLIAKIKYVYLVSFLVSNTEL